MTDRRRFLARGASLATVAAVPTAVASVLPGDHGIDVKAFGAVGDGVADDSAAINRALAAAAPRGGTVLFPPGVYRLATDGTLRGGRDLAIQGYGATLALDAGARFGIELQGENRRVHISGLRITGTGAVADDQCAIGTSVHPVEGTRTLGLCVADCEIERVARGVYVNVSGARHGDAQRIRVEGNFIHDIVGTASGQGYGIGLSGCWHNVIAYNQLDRVQRHSIYNSVSRFTVITGNAVHEHRAGVFTGSQLSAVVTARSSYVSISDNCLERCADGALSIEPHESEPGHVSCGISVIGNKFVESCHQDIIVGTSDPASCGPLRDVVVSTNAFYRAADPSNLVEAIRIFNGKQIRITGNHFAAGAPFGGRYCYIVLSGTTDATYTDDVRVETNSAVLATRDHAGVGLVELAAGFCTGRQRVRIARNDVTVDGAEGGAALFGALPATSPTLLIDQSPQVALLTYGPVVQTGPGGNRFCRLVIADARDFRIEPPQGGVSGMLVQYDIVNDRTARPGRMQWSPAFRLARGTSAPRAGQRRTITFYCDGRTWVEVGRSMGKL